MKEKELLKAIFEATLDDTLKWSLYNSCFNNDTTHKYHTYLGDGTEVIVDVRLTELLIFSYGSSIHVKNKNLIDGGIYFTRSKECDDIAEVVYNKFIKPNIKPRAKTQSEVIEDIINSIDSKEVLSDKRIDNIIC